MAEPEYKINVIYGEKRFKEPEYRASNVGEIYKEHPYLMVYTSLVFDPTVPPWEVHSEHMIMKLAPPVEKKSVWRKIYEYFY